MRRMSYRNKAKNAEEEQNFWPSYADMMSSFALIIFFLMLLAYLANIKTGGSLQQTEKQLSDALARMLKIQTEYDEANEDLQETKGQLAEKEDELISREQMLIAVRTMLDDANEELDAKEALLTEKESTLSEYEATIAQQEEDVLAARNELKDLQAQMQMIVGVRKVILDKIAEMLNSGQDYPSVSIGDNGNIIFNDNVLFYSGDYSLKKEAEPLLDNLIRALTAFLEDEENLQYIDSIIISGHADAQGSEDGNLTLSNDRARSVYDYIVRHSALHDYRNLFCVAGYGDSRPVATNETPEGRAQNRRIEIAIVLKDETVVNIVNDYLAGIGSQKGNSPE